MMPASLPDEWIAQVQEFVCPGCGREMVVLCGIVVSHPVCGACTFTPGWWRSADYRRMLDPDDDRDPAAVTMSVTEVECRAQWMQAILHWLSRRARIIEDHRPPEPLEETWRIH